MKWFKFESDEDEYTDNESDGMLIYLSPEALKHAVVIEDFEAFQGSPECVPGGRLLEVSRQFSFRLRQVADLVEEPIEQPPQRRSTHERVRGSGESGSIIPNTVSPQSSQMRSNAHQNHGSLPDRLENLEKLLAK